MTRLSKSGQHKLPDKQHMERKSGYPSGGKPINLLPKVPAGPGPSSPAKQRTPNRGGVPASRPPGKEIRVKYRASAVVVPGSSPLR